MLSYATVKADCLKKKIKFEDPDFPANDTSIGNILLEKLQDKGPIKWMRPKDILKKGGGDPKFVVAKTTRFDLIQGEVADCWFISAASCIATGHQSLLDRCAPQDQDFDKDYAGVFHFNFWNFGSWTEVIIDDQLPTIDGELLFAHNNEEPNEFWVPLFEKAYAKFKGSYSNLDGGQTTYALVDFTGGISERITLSERRVLSGRLFDAMCTIGQMSSLMGCEISARPGIMEGKLSSGLYMFHAYSITKIINVPLTNGKFVKLVRVRNPWGEGEWNGAWNDSSRKWDTVSADVKQDLELMKKDTDGEFWMSFDDWISNFDFLTICHLEPNAISDEDGKNKSKLEWETISYHSEWIAGFNAGGSGMLSFKQDQFFSNPQFEVTLELPSAKSGSKDNCHLIVSLMQQIRSWDEQNFISFDLYKVRDGVPLITDGRNYNKKDLTFVKKGARPERLREMTTHFELPPGNYVVIPYTMEANINGQFLLRIYKETKSESMQPDNQPTTVVPIQPALVPTKVVQVQDKAADLFKKNTNGKSNMEAKELVDALNQLLKSEGFSGFSSLEAARVFITMFDKERSGFLTSDGFCQLWKDVSTWLGKYRLFDEDRSESIDCSELSKAFSSIGLQISRQVSESLIRRYGGRGSKLSLDDFLLSYCKVINLYEQFKILSAGGKLKMQLEEWLATAVYF